MAITTKPVKTIVEFVACVVEIECPFCEEAVQVDIAHEVGKRIYHRTCMGVFRVELVTVTQEGV